MFFLREKENPCWTLSLPAYFLVSVITPTHLTNEDPDRPDGEREDHQNGVYDQISKTIGTHNNSLRYITFHYTRGNICEEFEIFPPGIFWKNKKESPCGLSSFETTWRDGTHDQSACR